jgi:hypothetical protein
MGLKTLKTVSYDSLYFILCGINPAENGISKKPINSFKGFCF